MLSRRTLWRGLPLLFITLTPVPSWGILGLGDIVYDPTAYANAVLMRIEMVKQTVNDATVINQNIQSLANQATALANQAKQLTQLPLSLVEELQAQVRNYTAILQEARGIVYSVQSSVSQFEQLYSTGFGGPDMLAKTQAMLTQVRDAGRVATQAQALFDRLRAQNTHLGTALSASQAAVGDVSAIQAQTQVMGILADQQASLQQIAAATGRVETSFILLQTTAAAQAKRNADRWLEGFGETPFKGPHQGQGKPLPDFR